MRRTVRSLPARPSASKKFTTTSGSSALWIMIWDISIWRRACGTAGKSLRPESVTHVAGTFSYLCLRVGPTESGGQCRARTCDLLLVRQAL